jgi:formylglycine-generating enzyme
LPTDAEWNYAAAGGSEQRVYAWGNSAPDADHAVYGCSYPRGSLACSGVVNIAPVGIVAAGVGKWGQFDLAGNLTEWVQDWGSVKPASCDDCTGAPESDTRVLRGSSFTETAGSLASSSSDQFFPSDHFAHYGARCARSR